MKTLALAISLTFNLTLVIAILIMHLAHSQEILKADTQAQQAEAACFTAERNLENAEEEIRFLETQLDRFAGTSPKSFPIPGTTPHNHASR
ncbi:MAG: hypothetical protein AAF491_07185 [Verrucomicrobiota bacterium]